MGSKSFEFADMIDDKQWPVGNSRQAKDIASSTVIAHLIFEIFRWALIKNGALDSEWALIRAVMVGINFRFYPRIIRKNTNL